jgi:acid phosphatase
MPRVAPLALLIIVAVNTLAGSGNVNASRAGAAVHETVRSAAAVSLPRPDHVVVVIMENSSYSSVMESGAAPYITELADQGASFTRFHATTHYSQPNYLALFSGSTQGVNDNRCPRSFDTANLSSELARAGLTFTGYAESMPSDGFTGCTAGKYMRQHNPWVNFTNVPADANRTFDAFPSDYATLPTVSFVVPNVMNDMYDGSIEQGDAWLREHLDGYAQWAKTHNSQLIVTWDEDNGDTDNHIPTVVVGANIRPGTYHEHVDHYDLLRTIEDYFGLRHLGASADAMPITDIFEPAPEPGDDHGSAAVKYGWTKQVYRDDFTGSSLGAHWEAYDSPGHNGKGIRSPEQIEVSNGILRMTGTPDGVTAGMAAVRAQRYGRWEVRARFPAGCGCYHPVLILWPESGDWPAGGEIDFAEVFDAGRQELNFFLHYSAENRQLSSERRVDMTQWHYFAVEWTPDHITGYVDGSPFFHTDRRDVQPPGPMAQTIQLDWFPEQGADTGAALEVDWAAMYAL